MQEKNIVLFDMDNTLVSADTVELWQYYLEGKGLVTAEEKLQWQKYHDDYVLGQLEVPANYEFEIGFLKKISMAERAYWQKDFFDSCIKPKISKTGLRLIKEYKQRPDTIVILITATISFIALPVAHYSGVNEVIATQEEIIAGEYTTHVVGTPSIGEGKKLRFLDWVKQNNIQARYTILYSDSINDLPLLGIVNKPIIVDPDEKLKAIAKQKAWDIISFKNSEQHCQPPISIIQDF